MRKPKLPKRIKSYRHYKHIALLGLVICLSLAAFITYHDVSTKKPIQVSNTAASGSGSNSVPICVKGEADCPSFGSSSNQSTSTSTPSQPTQPTTSSSSPAKSTTTAPTSSSTIQSDNAAKCAYFYSTMQSGAQSALEGSYNADVEQVQGDIQQYNETPPGLTESGVNSDIQSLNNEQQADYNEQLTGIQTYAVTYGCTLSLTPEPNLPSFNPPTTWHP